MSTKLKTRCGEFRASHRGGLPDSWGSEMAAKSRYSELLTAYEVAKMAKVSAKTVNRWRRDGLLTGIKIGNVVRFRHEDVDTFLDRHRG